MWMLNTQENPLNEFKMRKGKILLMYDTKIDTLNDLINNLFELDFYAT